MVRKNNSRNKARGSRSSSGNKSKGVRGLSPKTMQLITDINKSIPIKLSHYNRNYENPLQGIRTRSAKELQFAGHEVAQHYIKQWQRINKAIEHGKKHEPRKLSIEQKQGIGTKFLERAGKYLMKEYLKAGGTNRDQFERDYMMKFIPLKPLGFYTNKKGRDYAIERTNELYLLSRDKNAYKEYAFRELRHMQNNALKAIEKTMTGEDLSRMRSFVRSMSPAEFGVWAVKNRRWLTKLWYDSDPDVDISDEEQEEYQEKLLDTIPDDFNLKAS